MKYPAICATIIDPAFRNKFRDKFLRLRNISFRLNNDKVGHHLRTCYFSSLQLDTGLFDNEETDLEWERQPVLSSFCHPDQPENWEDILTAAPTPFILDVILYGQENLIKIHLFLSSPFATHYERDVETSTISFVANIGGEPFNISIFC